jgi:hypothetical protein
MPFLLFFYKKTSAGLSLPFIFQGNFKKIKKYVSIKNTFLIPQNTQYTDTIN